MKVLRAAPFAAFVLVAMVLVGVVSATEGSQAGAEPVGAELVAMNATPLGAKHGDVTVAVKLTDPSLAVA